MKLDSDTTAYVSSAVDGVLRADLLLDLGSVLSGLHVSIGVLQHRVACRQLGVLPLQRVFLLAHFVALSGRSGVPLLLDGQFTLGFRQPILQGQRQAISASRWLPYLRVDPRLLLVRVLLSQHLDHALVSSILRGLEVTLRLHEGKFVGFLRVLLRRVGAVLSVLKLYVRWTQLTVEQVMQTR